MEEGISQVKSRMKISHSLCGGEALECVGFFCLCFFFCLLCFNACILV